MLTESKLEKIISEALKAVIDEDIHIKEKNKGKFTALKKRTGHSASWFKKNGTPHQKQMATFDLNAEKWNKN